MLPLRLREPPAIYRLARQAEEYARGAVAAAYPRCRLSLALAADGGVATVELRSRSRRLDAARRPGRPLPTCGDLVGWRLYWAACWWTFRRRVGCPGCGGVICRCAELAAAEAAQVELEAWLAERGWR